jgi:outer membrane biosynthesis protein TonB
MNSRTCITLSKASALGSAVAAAALILGCGGGAPDPREADLIAARAVAEHETEAGENGEGSISFHYTNKSTDANLTIDLGTTDLYMEMSGAPPKTPEGEAAPGEKPAAQPRKAAKPPQEEQESRDEEPERTSMRQPPKAQAPKKEKEKEKEKEPEAKQELSLPEEEPANYEDVTQRVLTGIRKAQELFYQKRYPEALQAVKSSLDARPTAEGHALAGSIHYMMNQGGMARRQWSEALRLNPDMPSVVNMLEKTRTPGGRGSPSPRPILSRPSPRPAPAALPEADRPPFPEVYYEPAYNPPASSAPAAAAPAAPAAASAAHAPESAPAEPPMEEAGSEPEAAHAPVEPQPAAPAAPAAPAKAAPAPASPGKAAPTAAPAKAPVKTHLPAASKAKHAEEAKPK